MMISFVIKKMKRLSVGLSVFALALLVSTYSHAVPGDYDGDGLSDMSVALVNKSTKYTAWLTRLTNGSPAKFWTWGLPADALVAGRFFAGDAKYYPGIVYVRSSAFPLEWYIKNAANTDVFFKFGLPGDTISNLGDWDGDGVDDIHVVRKESGFLYWYVAMSGTPGVIQKFLFGMDGDRVGLSDVDGDGKVEMIALRAGFNWYIRDPADAENVYSSTQWGLPGDFPILPRDLDGDGKTDFIIARKTGSFQVAYIKYGNGQTENVTLGFDSSVPQLGNFLGATQTFAWSQRDTGWVAFRGRDGTPNVFRHGISTNAIIAADGTVIQPSDDGTFGGTTSGGGDSDSGSGGGSGGGSASCSTVYSSGWLLKPAAQDTGGSRLGKPLILTTRNYPPSGCLNVIATNGTVVAHYGKYATNRHYSGWGCGEGYSGSKIASLAVAASGSKNIYVQDPKTGACYGPGPADGRTDRR